MRPASVRRDSRASRIGLAAAALLSTAVASPAPSRVEVRDADIVYALSLDAAGKRLMLDNQGSLLPFGECADEAQGLPTSQRALVAAVFVRNCGATVDFGTHVLLRSGTESRSVAIFDGKVPVSVNWSPSGLRVTHAPLPPARVVRHEPAAFGAAIAYASSGTPTAPNKYVEFSSFNYGATGRAAGLPAEVLLRVAGWSQQASGVYRPEWGTWNGPAPYGDDPVGSLKVREGILHFEQGPGKDRR